jgi:glycosyltransferase involved in cell wall biosynthesis
MDINDRVLNQWVRKTIPFWFLCLYMFLIPFGQCFRFQTAENALGISSVLALIMIIWRMPNILAILKTNFFVQMLVILSLHLAFTNLQLNGQEQWAAYKTNAMFLIYAGLTAYVIGLSLDQKQQRILFLVMSSAILLSSLLTLIDYRKIIDIPYFNEYIYKRGPTGPFLRRSSFAMIWSVYLTFILAYGMQKSEKAVKFLVFFTVGLGAAAIAITRNRSFFYSFMAIALLIIIGLYFQHRAIKKALLNLSYFLTIGFFMYTILAVFFPLKLDQIKKTGHYSGQAYYSQEQYKQVQIKSKKADQLRLLTLQKAARQIFSKPWGNGISRIPIQSFKNKVDPHSNLVWLLWATGWIGAIWLLMIAIWFKQKLRVYNNFFNDQRFPFVFAGAAWLLTGLVHTNWTMGAGWIMIGILISLKPKTIEKEDRAQLTLGVIGRGALLQSDSGQYYCSADDVGLIHDLAQRFQFVCYAPFFYQPGDILYQGFSQSAPAVNFPANVTILKLHIPQTPGRKGSIRKRFGQIASVLKISGFLKNKDAIVVFWPSPISLLSILISRWLEIPCFIYQGGTWKKKNPQHYEKKQGKYSELSSRIKLKTASIMEDFILGSAPVVFVRGVCQKRNYVYVRGNSSIEKEQFFRRADTCQSQPIKLLAVSNIVPNKRIEDIILAVRYLKEHYGIIHYTHVGGKFTENITQMKKLAIENNINDQVTFLGHLTNTPDLLMQYRQSDIFVLASEAEGFPRVIVEAMSQSLPVVCSAIDGIKDIFTNEQQVLMFPAGDFQSLAHCIRRIIENRSLRMTLICQGYQFAEHEFNQPLPALLIAEKIKNYLSSQG